MAAATDTGFPAIWQSLNLPQRVSAGLSVAVLVGALGPWKTWGSEYVWGIEGGGWLIVLCAAAAVGLMAFGASAKARRYGPPIFFGLAAVLSLIEILSLGDTVVTPGIGGLFRLLSWGLPVALLASLAAAVAAALAYYQLPGVTAPASAPAAAGEPKDAAPAARSFFRR